MGEIPRDPLFSVKLWFAIALLASATVRISAEQVISAPPPVSPPQKVSAPERKTLSREVPAQTRADILMARGEYAAAISAFQQSDLKSAVVWNSIGMAYHHLYALEEARKAYQQALIIKSALRPGCQ